MIYKLLRLRRIYARLRNKRESEPGMFIIRLNRKEKHSYEEDNKHYITGIGKNIEKKRKKFNLGVYM